VNGMSRHTLRPGISVAQLNARAEGFLPGLFGVEVLAIAPAQLSGRLTIRPEMLAPNGFLHAATLIALADTCAGFATIAHLPEGAKGFTTIELKANFLGTATSGESRCQATASHTGRTTQVWDAVVQDAEDRQLALFRCTQMVLWPKS